MSLQNTTPVPGKLSVVSVNGDGARRPRLDMFPSLRRSIRFGAFGRKVKMEIRVVPAPEITHEAGALPVHSEIKADSSGEMQERAMSLLRVIAFKNDSNSSRMPSPSNW